MKSHRVADIASVVITLKVGGEQALFLLIASDGTVNRMGSGDPAVDDRDLYIGRVDPPLLPQAVEALSDDMLQFLGDYDITEKRGLTCELSILFNFTDGNDDGLTLTYGIDSQGPPDDIASFVRHAVAISEPWYQQQERIAGVAGPSAPPKQPWWRLW